MGKVRQVVVEVARTVVVPIVVAAVSAVMVKVAKDVYQKRKDAKRSQSDDAPKPDNGGAA